MIRRIGIVGLGLILGLSGVTLLFVLLSALTPWPGAMLVRVAFDIGGARVSQKLAAHVPDGVSSMLDVSYDPNDPDALLDVYFPTQLPAGQTALPTLVWIHGGAWVSGGRWQIAQYASIIAAQGYSVVVVGYSLAPERIYPAALRQVNLALGFLGAQGRGLHADPGRLILAGDSAGAQIAAQLANAITSPDYAEIIGIAPAMDKSNLRGVVLFSGAFDLGLVNFDGPIGMLLRSVLWAYTGSADFATDSRFEPASVIRFLTPAFPPTFISAGDADPLLAHSIAFAQTLEKLGVETHALFFRQGDGLGHNYQFDLDAEAGRTALRHLLEFLDNRSRLSRTAKRPSP